jgi:hypothetical protein
MEIVTQIANDQQYCALCKQIARPDLADDLYQEFLVALITFPDLEVVHQKEWFPFLCTCIIKNLYNSPSSTFYQQYRAPLLRTKGLTGELLNMAEEPAKPVDEKLEQMISLLEKLNWPSRQINKANLKARTKKTLTRRPMLHIKIKSIAAKT